MQLKNEKRNLLYYTIEMLNQDNGGISYFPFFIQGKSFFLIS